MLSHEPIDQCIKTSILGHGVVFSAVSNGSIVRRYERDIFVLKRSYTRTDCPAMFSLLLKIPLLISGAHFYHRVSSLSFDVTVFNISIEI